MRSRTEIVAVYRAGPRPGTGHTVVTSIRAGQHVAARQTGPGQVHLVGTAAGPLGGDEVQIAIRLGPGAGLDVRSVGATIVQPGLREAASDLRLQLQIGDDAQLNVALEPTVVIHRAEHRAVTEVELAGAGQVRLLEQVLLGRSGEPGGTWTGSTRATRDGWPLLSHTVHSPHLTADDTRVISTLLVSGVPAQPATVGSAVAMPLAAGGLLVTSTGSRAIDVRAALEAAEVAAVHHQLFNAANG